jgi:hypothetical protein
LDLEAALARGLTDDVQFATEDLGSPVDQAAGEALIRPELLDLRVVEPGPQERSACAVAVLDARRTTWTAMSRPGVSVTRNRLRPLTFLPASKPLVATGTVSAVRMDCESIRPALGSALRPSASRTLSRSASWTRSTVPSSCHQVKYQYTVGQGGKSFGSCRQAHPVRTT